MSLEFEIPLVSFIFVIMISIVYFSKKKLNLVENKAYKVILICSIIEIAIDLGIHILCSLNSFSVIESSYYNLLNILNKILSQLFIIIFSSFLYYIIVITYRKQVDTKKIFVPLLILNVISFLVLQSTKIKLVKVGSVTNVTGSTTMFGYGIVAILLFVSLTITLLNIKRIDKRYLSIFSILGIMGILYALTLIWPGIIIYDLVLALLCYIMFFTIENPDVKMIYELNKNKKLLESMSEEKSNFLFSMSQETRKPIENILEVKKILEDEKDLEKLDNGLKVIENNARSLNNIINNILDISNISSSKLATSTDTYNPYSLITMCIKNVEQKLGSKVKLKTNISENLPKEIYGDSVRLKQVITSILYNSAKYTKDGYIELSVNEIVKYDVVRLVISIEDTGKGISVDKLNKLLKSNSSIEDTDLLKLNDLDVDLKLAFKIMRKQGGVINVKSEDGKGSTFTIVIDQRIKKTDDEYYNKYLFNKKKVIVISDKLQTLKDINSLANKYDIELLTSMFGNDLVQRIKDGEVFDLIILEDEMKPDSALTILGKMQEVKKGFNIPTAVMLKKDKESIKKHYIEDGFDAYIRKETMEEDLDGVIKKYI